MLHSWEGEGEPKVVLLLLPKKVVLQHEVPQPVRHEVEQVLARPDHQLLADRVLGRLHPHAGALVVQLDQDHPEVGAAQVESKVGTMLSTCGKLTKMSLRDPQNLPETRR